LGTYLWFKIACPPILMASWHLRDNLKFGKGEW